MSADPVIVTRTETVRVCPPEIVAPVPAKPTPAADARLSGNASGMGWLNATLAWAAALADRLRDAATACPEASR